MDKEARKAIEDTIKIWEERAGTGFEEHDEEECPLCEYVMHRDGTCRDDCPQYPFHGLCISGDRPYHGWASCKTPSARKKAAQVCVEKLKALLEDE